MIFFLEETPHACAAAYADAHIVPAIDQGFRALAFSHVSQKSHKAYLVYHIDVVDNDWNEWCARSARNFGKLLRLVRALCFEHQYRFGTSHMFETILEGISHPPIMQELGELDELPLTMAQSRAVYSAMRSDFEWTDREAPSWLS